MVRRGNAPQLISGDQLQEELRKQAEEKKLRDELRRVEDSLATIKHQDANSDPSETLHARKEALDRRHQALLNMIGTEVVKPTQSGPSSHLPAPFKDKSTLFTSTSQPSLPWTNPTVSRDISPTDVSRRSQAWEEKKQRFLMSLMSSSDAPVQQQSTSTPEPVPRLPQPPPSFIRTDYSDNIFPDVQRYSPPIEQPSVLLGEESERRRAALKKQEQEELRAHLDSMKAQPRDGQRESAQPEHAFSGLGTESERRRAALKKQEQEELRAHLDSMKAQPRDGLRESAQPGQLENLEISNDPSKSSKRKQQEEIRKILEEQIAAKKEREKIEKMKIIEEDEKFMRKNPPVTKTVEISSPPRRVLEISSPRKTEDLSPVRQPMRLHVSTPVAVNAGNLEISSGSRDLEISSPMRVSENKLLDALLAQQKQIMEMQQAAISELRDRLDKKEEISRSSQRSPEVPDLELSLNANSKFVDLAGLTFRSSRPQSQISRSRDSAISRSVIAPVVTVYEEDDLLEPVHARVAKQEISRSPEALLRSMPGDYAERLPTPREDEEISRSQNEFVEEGENISRSPKQFLQTLPDHQRERVSSASRPVRDEEISRSPERWFQQTLQDHHRGQVSTGDRSFRVEEISKLPRVEEARGFHESQLSGRNSIDDHMLETLDRFHSEVPDDPFGSFIMSSPAWSSISFEENPGGFEKLRSALDSASSLDDGIKRAFHQLLSETSDLSALRSQRKLLDFKN